MAMAVKPSEANTIRPGQLKAFAKIVKESIPDKSYWEECKDSCSFSDEETKKMKELIDS